MATDVNDKAFGIAFIGKFDNRTVEFPTKEQLDGLTMLILTGIDMKKLSENYVIYPPECFNPKVDGIKKKIPDIYNLKSWPNFYLNVERSVCITD